MVDLGIPGLEDAELVGRGGSGQVFRARQPALDREVAVKVLRIDEVTADQVRLFERECAAVGRLGWSPDIVSVFSAGTTPEGDPYMVMEYAPDGSLRDRLRAVGRLGEAEAREVAVHIGSALAHAHDAGLLHRDIKPANILISRRGHPILADFGIAKILGRTGATSTWAMSGTLSYMAPEVLLDSPASPASDIYSLGATLFEALSGRTPFATGTNDSPATVLRRALEGTEVDLGVLDGVSDQLLAVLARCLAVDVDQRYASAHQLLDDLSAAAAPPGPVQESISVHPARPAPPPYPPDIDPTQLRSRPRPAPPPAPPVALPPQGPPLPGPRAGRSAGRWAAMAAIAIVVIGGIALGATLLAGGDDPSKAAPAPSGSSAPDDPTASTTRACWDGAVVEEDVGCSTDYDVRAVYWAFNFDPEDYACEQKGDDGRAVSYADDHCSFPPSYKQVHLGIYTDTRHRDRRLQEYDSCRVVDADKHVMRCGAGSVERVALRYDSDDHLIYVSAATDRVDELDFLLRRMRSLDEVRNGIPVDR